MDQLHNATAVSPDRVDRSSLLGYRIITAAVIRFTSFLFPIPFIVVLALLSPSQYHNLDLRGRTAGSPPPSPLRYNNAFIFIARIIQHFLASSIRVDLHLPTLLGDFSR